MPKQNRVNKRKMPMPKKAKRNQRRTRRLQPHMRVSTIPASVNTATSINSNQPKSLTQTNTDRLLQVTLPAGLARGSVVLQQIITSTITSRLRAQASLFQRWSVKSLRFEIQTQTPTTNSGGYAVGYLKDPSMELGSGLTALKNLTAIQGSKTTKWWQSTELNVRPNKQQFYCANGNEIRLFSPGQLIMLCDGPPTETVDVTVIMHWTVTFTEPALQRLPLTLPKLTLVASAIQTTADSAELKTVNVGLTGTTTTVSLENAFPNLPPKDIIGTNLLWYRLNNPIVNQYGTTSPVLRVNSFIYFRVVADASGGGSHIELGQSAAPHLNIDQDVSASSFYVAWQGDSFTPVIPSEYTGTSDNASGFWSVHQSPSVNQQLMIYKTYQTPQQIVSSSETNAVVSELSTLSTLLNPQ